MTRIGLGVLAAATLAGCTGLVGSPVTAPPRALAEDTSYCTAVRSLDATLDNSINQFASPATLAADAAHLAADFDGTAARWKAAGKAGWQLLSSIAANLRRWSAAISAGDNESANSTVLALWRQAKALPACGA